MSHREPACWAQNGGEQLLNFVTGDPFTMGQSYDPGPAKQIACGECGSTEFHVAQGDYYVVIRCPKCRWEGCVADG